MSTTTDNQSFVFYETFLIAANELEGEDKTDLLQAILEYGLYETEPTFKKKYMNAIWIGIKTPIDGAKKRRKFSQENGSKSSGNKTSKKAITDVVTDFKAEVVSEPSQPNEPILESTPEVTELILESIETTPSFSIDLEDASDDEVVMEESSEIFELANGVKVAVPVEFLEYFNNIKNKPNIIRGLKTNTKAAMFCIDLSERFNQSSFKITNSK